VTRRELIALLASTAAVSWPRAVRASIRMIGFMGSGAAAAQGRWTAAVMERLQELGWAEGRNVAIDYRWADGSSERFAEIAAEFVRQNVDLILTHNTLPTLAAKQATSTIPIVFAAVGDPVANGLVASLWGTLIVP
jgi:putative ABC transport system substrate-binding protein